MDFEKSSFSRLSSVTLFHMKSQAEVTGWVSLTSRSNSSSILDGRARLSLPIPLKICGKWLTLREEAGKNAQGWFVDVSAEERQVGDKVKICHALGIWVR